MNIYRETEVSLNNFETILKIEKEPRPAELPNPTSARPILWAVMLLALVQVPVASGDRIVVRRGQAPFPMVRLPGHSFYRTLRDKLGWGAAPPGDRGA